ncbi:hypothetical protein ACJ2A9_09110 [Anaerobacillus sp. MEB173]|uniref:hypothetical protein n=1 Tax=Anaerobacillus sp. MEB173 TaxID=3383345 RepID=UPI003F924A29
MIYKLIVMIIMSLPVLMGFSYSDIQNLEITTPHSDEQLKSIPFNGSALHNADNNEKRSLTVKSEARGKDVYVECHVPNFTFKEPDRMEKVDGEGHLQLYVDGNKVDSIYKAAFIIKGLPTGKHTLKIELVHNDHTSYGLEDEFEVTIP